MASLRFGGKSFTSPRTLLPGQGNQQQPQQSPALAAMARTGAPPSMGGQPKPQATPQATPETNPQAGSSVDTVPRYDVVNVDTTQMEGAYGQQDNAFGQQQAAYDRMLGDQQKLWDDSKFMMQQNFSGQMRRNASNAARQGLALGGASYLSGQRSAANQAADYNRQATMDFTKQRLGIQGDQANAFGNQATAFGQRASAWAGVAGTNANNTNAANRDVWNRGNELDDQRTAAAAELKKNNNIAAAQDVKTKFEYLFNNNNYRAGDGQFRSLMGEYEATLSNGTDEEIAAAYNKLMGYIEPIQQARETWANSREKAGGMSLEEYMKRGSAPSQAPQSQGTAVGNALRNTLGRR